MSSVTKKILCLALLLTTDGSSLQIEARDKDMDTLQNDTATAVQNPTTSIHFKRFTTETTARLRKVTEHTANRWIMPPFVQQSSKHAWLDSIPKNVAQKIAGETSQWLAVAYNPAQTTFELSPPLKAQRRSPFPDAFESKLIQEGFALSHPTQAVSDALWLRYELSHWESGWMLTLYLPDQHINRLFNVDGTPSGAVHSKQVGTL